MTITVPSLLSLASTVDRITAAQHQEFLREISYATARVWLGASRLDPNPDVCLLRARAFRAKARIARDERNRLLSRGAR